MSSSSRRRRYQGAKNESVNRSLIVVPGSGSRSNVKSQTIITPTSAADFRNTKQVGDVLTGLLAHCQASDAAAALIPWFCDSLPSPKSRRDYYRDLSTFFSHLSSISVHPFAATGDHVRLYKEAMIQSGKRPATVARSLSVIRGTYEQFGKKGLVPWNTVGDIQSVAAPRVAKNSTPLLGEDDACRLLYAPDTDTMLGCRDHALLFTYFKTACRSSAVAHATVGDLERSDTDWFLRITEKGRKERRIALLEAAPAVLAWIEQAGLTDDELPLFPALDRDRETPTERHLTGRTILYIVKKYGRRIGLNVSPHGRRGVCTHSLRKTVAVNALRHGAHVHQVQQWLGHSDIRTTQEYINYHEDDAEEAARRCQIR